MTDAALSTSAKSKLSTHVKIPRSADIHDQKHNLLGRGKDQTCGLVFNFLFINMLQYDVHVTCFLSSVFLKLIKISLLC